MQYNTNTIWWGIGTSGSKKSACFVIWLDKKCLFMSKWKKWFSEYKCTREEELAVGSHFCSPRSWPAPRSDGPQYCPALKVQLDPSTGQRCLGSMHRGEETWTAGGPLQPHGCGFAVPMTGERCRMLPHPQDCKPGAGNFCFSPSHEEGFLFSFASSLTQIPGLEYRGGTGVD